MVERVVVNGNTRLARHASRPTGRQCEDVSRVYAVPTVSVVHPRPTYCTCIQCIKILQIRTYMAQLTLHRIINYYPSHFGSFVATNLYRGNSTLAMFTDLSPSLWYLFDEALRVIFVRLHLSRNFTWIVSRGGNICDNLGCGRFDRKLQNLYTTSIWRRCII